MPGAAEKGQSTPLFWPESPPVRKGPSNYLEGPCIEGSEWSGSLRRHEKWTFLTPPFSEGSAPFLPFSAWLKLLRIPWAQ